MENVKVRLHLASGKSVDGEVELPEDLDDDESIEAIVGELPVKPSWGVVAGIGIHSGALSAIELL